MNITCITPRCRYAWNSFSIQAEVLSKKIASEAFKCDSITTIRILSRSGAAALRSKRVSVVRRYVVFARFTAGRPITSTTPDYWRRKLSCRYIYVWYLSYTPFLTDYLKKSYFKANKRLRNFLTRSVFSKLLLGILRGGLSSLRSWMLEMCG